MQASLHSGSAAFSHRPHMRFSLEGPLRAHRPRVHQTLLSESVAVGAQVPKAKKHDQRVAVCIVRAANGAGGHHYLLVKRAEKGLLAGGVRQLGMQQNRNYPRPD